MPNYYEILQIRPDAPAPEVEAAYEAQYNRWRRLVTHHDPETADKATRALRILEQIRATLTDSAKRAAYDATLDLSGTVSGLADPQAQPARPVAPPLPPRPPAAPPAAPTARLDAWQCPKCHSASPVGTRYCRHCGNEIGRDCPKCGKLIEKTICFCPECGVEVEAYIAEKQREAEEFARRQQEEARREAEERARREAREQERRRRRNRVIGYVMGLLVIVVLAWVGISSAIQFAEEQKSYAQATATMAAQYANATATVEAVLVAGGRIRRDGLMVYVPAGEFQMGSNDGGNDEQPVHTVVLDDFWIDRTEVTNLQYQRCVDAGVCSPLWCKWNNYDYYSESIGAERPAVCVGWENARTYCQWVGAELPTEAQWEYAARGPENRIYPWGNEWREGLANFKFNTTVPVGRFPEGASWVGALDMAGNAWEWTADWYADYVAESQTNPRGPAEGDYKVLRGGSWYVRVNAASRSIQRDVGLDVGFRCVTTWFQD